NHAFPGANAFLAQQPGAPDRDARQLRVSPAFTPVSVPLNDGNVSRVTRKVREQRNEVSPGHAGTKMHSLDSQDFTPSYGVRRLDSVKRSVVADRLGARRMPRKDPIGVQVLKIRMSTPSGATREI